MAIVSRKQIHIYQISQGLRASGEPPAQGPNPPTGGSVTPLANLFSWLPFIFVPLAVLAFSTIPPRPLNVMPATPTTGSVESLAIMQPLPSAAAGDIRAFYNAEGYGAVALNGCRSGLRVVFLDDLDQNDLHDLYDLAVDDDVLTVIIPRVAGHIGWVAETDNAKSCMYFAGHAAPGQGIRLRTLMDFRDSSNDIVVRGIRWLKPETACFRVSSGTAMYFENYSCLRTVGTEPRPVQISGTAVDSITVTDGIVAETNDGERNLMVSGSPNDNPGTNYITVTKHLFATGLQRSFMCSTWYVYGANNLTYNWGNRAFEWNESAICDFVSNWAMAGPMTPTTGHKAFPFGTLGVDWTPYDSIFIDNNIGGPYYFDGPVAQADAWDSNKQQVTCYNDATAGRACSYTLQGDSVINSPDTIVAATSRQTTPPTWAVTLIPVLEVKDSALDHAGFDRSLDSLGFWRYVDEADGDSIRDDLDLVIVAYVVDSAGPSSAVDADTTTFTTINSASPYFDGDNDGMPRGYENQCGYDDSDDTDAAGDADGDGYYNLEEYLSGGNSEGQGPSWTDASDNEESFVVLVKRAGAGGWVVVGSVAANITSLDDPVGRPGDIYGVAAKNVNATSDTLIIGTAGCS